MKLAEVEAAIPWDSPGGELPKRDMSREKRIEMTETGQDTSRNKSLLNTLKAVARWELDG